MNLGPTELLLILGIVVLVFGIRKLPQLGRDLGAGIREFKKAGKEIVGEDKDE